MREVIQSLSGAVRDRKTTINDRVQKWQTDVDECIGEATAAFPGGKPNDVRTAEEEIKKCLE